jgi:hypothetical protein
MFSESEISMARSRKQSPQSMETELPQRRARAAAIGIDTFALGQTAFDRAGFDDPTLVLRWREIAGPQVARLARPLRISQGPSGGVLTLKAEPAAAMFLQHESRTICDRINTYLGRAAVTRLRFVPGEIPPEKSQPKQSHPQDSLLDDPAGHFVGPDDLKTALLALARIRRRS